jgi:hypothetical protein
MAQAVASVEDHVNVTVLLANTFESLVLSFAVGAAQDLIVAAFVPVPPAPVQLML